MSDVILWYVWVQVFAFGGWLIASPWLNSLPDHGYGISKALGILLGGFAYWIIVTIGLSRNESGAVLLALACLIVIGLILRQVERGPDKNITRQPFVLRPSTVVITTELIFAIAFVVCAVYRSYNPEIVEAGGEKFMESMYLNAILRSPTFPPNDAWLSGFSISYYYFGYVILAMITKISGIAPGIAFNLGGAMIFALTLTSAFSAGYNLWASHKQQTATVPATEPNPLLPRRHASGALVAGLLTAIMLGVMGNLGGFMESMRCARVLPQAFWTWLDVRQIDTKPIECSGVLPTRFYWWWDWSRVVHDHTPAGADQEVITETPAFSFILGDNHPHVMSLPFVLLAITLALHFMTTSRIHEGQITEGQQRPRNGGRFTLDSLPPIAWLVGHAPDLLLTAIVIGGLSFMNTWDFPVYGALLVGAVLLGRWYRHEELLPGLVFGVIVFILGYVFYLPFYATFASQARGIGVNLFNGTRFVQFFLMFGPFLVAAPIFIWRTARESGVAAKRLLVTSLELTLGGVLIAVAGAIILGLLSPQGRAYAAEMNTAGTVMGVTRDTLAQRLVDRLTDPWVPLFLAGIAALCTTLIVTRSQFKLSNHDAHGVIPATQGDCATIKSFVLLLFLGGALLTVAVEFIFLQDLFGTRMNTVFKFYYQGWTVWAVAGAFALMSFLEARSLLANIGLTLVGGLLLAGLLFPVFAAISKTNGFSATPTLDGSAYLQQSKPDDAGIIAWLNQNVHGDPFIAEAPADHYGAYSYNGRISAFTGLPTILGWGGHEHQWRGNYDEPARREPFIETLYNTTDAEEAQRVLHQFNVQYVIVGAPERTKYTPEGLQKFSQICRMAFQSGDSAVYACNP